MTMTARELKLDYFKFYDLPNQRIDDRVVIQGQFDKDGEVVHLVYLDLFGTPARKNREALYNPGAYLAWYGIFDPIREPTRQVDVENQFGRQRLIIGAARWFLAPARLYGVRTSPTARLDHYKVYRVLHAQPVVREVTLQDGWSSVSTPVGTPVAFAVPVTKDHAGTKTPITNKDAHLVIYMIRPAPLDRVIRFRDQFAVHEAPLVRSMLLAAPSLKLRWR